MKPSRKFTTEINLSNLWKGEYMTNFGIEKKFVHIIRFE